VLAKQASRRLPDGHLAREVLGPRPSGIRVRSPYGEFELRRGVKITSQFVVKVDIKCVGFARPRQDTHVGC
jgi:hypothetical protein